MSKQKNVNRSIKMKEKKKKDVNHNLREILEWKHEKRNENKAERKQDGIQNRNKTRGMRGKEAKGRQEEEQNSKQSLDRN